MILKRNPARRSTWILLILLILLLPFTAACDLLNLQRAGTPSNPADVVVIQWFRNGGIAGLCDEMTITADGYATISSCSDPGLAELGRLRIPEDTWVMLNSALGNLGEFRDVQSDDAAADEMTLTLIFNGRGATEPHDLELEALHQTAARLFADLSSPVTLGCTLTAVAETSIYQRPGLDSQLFGTLAAGDSVEPKMRSLDGWLGFDPGTAQASNVGLFRLRWIASFSQVSLEGGCEFLPEAPVISSTACYAMAASSIDVRSMPEDGAEVISSLAVDGYARVTGINAADWLRVDLNDSSQPANNTGWISPADANLNGPCDDLELTEAP